MRLRPPTRVGSLLLGSLALLAGALGCTPPCQSDSDCPRGQVCLAEYDYPSVNACCPPVYRCGASCCTSEEQCISGACEQVQQATADQGPVPADDSYDPYDPYDPYSYPYPSDPPCTSNCDPGGGDNSSSPGSTDPSSNPDNPDDPSGGSSSGSSGGP